MNTLNDGSVITVEDWALIRQLGRVPRRLSPRCEVTSLVGRRGEPTCRGSELGLVLMMCGQAGLEARLGWIDGRIMSSRATGDTGHVKGMSSVGSKPLPKRRGSCASRC